MKFTKSRNLTVLTYEVGSFFVFLYDYADEDRWEVWLQHYLYGVSSLMFGGSNYDSVGNYMSSDRILELVESNLDELIAIYKEEYMDEE